MKRTKLSQIFFAMGMICELLVSPSGFMIGDYGERWIILAGIICFSASLLMSMELKKDWKYFVPLFGFALVCYYFQRSALVLRLCLILMAGRQMDRKRLARFFFFGTAATIALGLILAFTPLGGPLYMEEWFRHAPEVRYCFGFLHPNSFALFWIRLGVLGLYLYADRLGRAGFAAAAALYVVPLLFARSKIALAAYVLMLVLVPLLRAAKTREKLYRGVFTGAAVLIALEELLVFTLGIFPYPERNPGYIENYWDLLNNITSGRLEHAREALQHSLPALFGLKDSEVWNGTEIGFIHSLYHEGILFMILYSVLLFWLLKRLKRERDLNGLLLLILITLYCIAEAFLPWFNKNAVWLLLIGGLPAFMMPHAETKELANEKNGPG